MILVVALAVATIGSGIKIYQNVIEKIQGLIEKPAAAAPAVPADEKPPEK